MRIILRCDRYTRIDDMLTKLQWMNMKQVIEYNALVFIHQIKLELMPHTLQLLLIVVVYIITTPEIKKVIM